MTQPTLLDLTEPADLAELYDTVLAPSFPPTELQEREEFLAECASGGLRVVGIRRDGHVVAGAVASASAPGGVVLLVYLAIAPGQRGGGIGGALLDGAVARWVEDLSPAFVLAEVEHPDHHAASAEHGDPAARLRFYARHGGRVLAVPYFQPSIGPGLPRVPALLLMTLHVAPSVLVKPDRTGAPGAATEGPSPEHVVAAPLHAFLEAYLVGCEGAPASDPAAHAMLAAVAGETVALWSPDHLAEVPVGTLD